MSVAPRKRCVLALTATVLLCSAMIVQADHEPLCISRPDSGSMECVDSLSQAEPASYDAFTECEYYVFVVNFRQQVMDAADYIDEVFVF